MTDIIAFISTRLDEREQRARQAEHAVGTKYDPLVLSLGETVSIPLMELYREANPAHVLAEVKAKRAILALWRTAYDRYMRYEGSEATGSAWAIMDRILVALAGVHRAHPDYAGDNVGDWTWPDDEARDVNAT